MPAVAITVEPVNEDEALASPAFPQADEVTICEVAPKGYQFLKLHLAPGRYILFCNMEGHYMAGMHTELVVR